MMNYLVILVAFLFSTTSLFAVDASRVISGLFCPSEYTGGVSGKLSSNYLDFCHEEDSSSRCSETVDVMFVDEDSSSEISPVSETVTLLDTTITVEEDVKYFKCVYQDTKLVFEQVESEKESKNIYYWNNSNMTFQEISADGQDSYFGDITDGATMSHPYTIDQIVLSYPSSGEYSHIIDITNLVMTGTEQVICHDDECENWDTETISRDMSADSMTITATSDTEEVSFESHFKDLTCDSAESCEITCFNDLPLFTGTTRIGKMNMCIDGIEVYELSIDDDGKETYIRLGGE